ncbi:MAG: hypothetical protein Q9162_004238 [Coniocarpon cinnabarinum]
MARPRPVESWDDDVDLEGKIFFAPNRSAVKTSVSSRHSIHSESDFGDKDWQLPLNVNDHSSTFQAISSANQAGIPLPQNVPASALLGGSIKRLGKKNSRQNIEEDWANDLQLPSTDSSHLKLKTPQQQPAPGTDNDDFEDWTEGSLGIRNGGTRRDVKNRGSSASAMSPSMGSCLTFDSEEDNFGGLEIPTGPLNFQEALKKRKASELTDVATATPSRDVKRDAPVTPTERSMNQNEDFFADVDFGAGDVFDPRKRPINRNIKAQAKPSQTSSPLNRPQATLTFSERAGQTRLPRPISGSKPSATSRLEPVYETGATNVARPRNSENLRSKRSAPALRSTRSQLTKQPSVPSLPSAANLGQPNYLKPTRAQPHTRLNSDPERSASPLPRPTIRPLSQGQDTPTRPKRDASTSLAREAATKRTVTRPARRRNFGDGTELDIFDDLPTSVAKEKQFTKQPAARQPGTSLRSTKSTRSLVPARDKAATPLPIPSQNPRSPTKNADTLPRFARDTAASRIAREQTLNTVPERRPESVLANRTNWQAHVAARSPHGSPTAQRGRKNIKLINPGKENTRHLHDEAARKGMHWNPHALRWEGNDAALHAFSPPPPSPPRPALITNMTAQGPGAGSSGVQVNGGMVFDPQRMCWLKMGRNRNNSVASNNQVPMSPTQDDEEEDPFADIEDLKDDNVPGRPSTGAGAQKETGMSVDLGGLLPVHEEFDVGPEFIRRQREEEATWRQKVAPWFPEGTETDWVKERAQERLNWKWAIRNIAQEVDEMSRQL